MKLTEKQKEALKLTAAQKELLDAMEISIETYSNNPRINQKDILTNYPDPDLSSIFYKHLHLRGFFDEEPYIAKQEKPVFSQNVRIILREVREKYMREITQAIEHFDEHDFLSLLENELIELEDIHLRIYNLKKNIETGNTNNEKYSR